MTFRSAHIKTEWLGREQSVKHEDTRFAEVTINRMNKGNMKVLTASDGILTKSKYAFLNKYKNFFVKGSFESWTCFKEKTKKVKKKVPTKKEDKKSKKETNKQAEKDKNVTTDKKGNKIITEVVKASDFGVLEYTFTANSDGIYQFKTYYSTDTDCTLNNKRYIDGELVKTKSWSAYKGVKNANVVNKKLKKGEHTISLLVDNRCIWLGCVGVKIDSFKADTKNNGYLTLSEFDVEKTNEFGVTSANVTIFNDRIITEQGNQYHTEKNISKLLFDWRDEINIKVADDNGKKQHIFGGYISTLSFDEDFMGLTLNCADRLIDCEHKYCFAELRFLKGDGSNSEYKGEFKRNFNRHGAVLNFLTKSADVPLLNNVNAKTGLIKGESYKSGMSLEYLYGKKYKKKSPAYKCKAKGVKMGADSSYSKTKTPYLELRNETQGDQEVEIFNSKWYPKRDATGFEITNFPTFYIEYGLGDKKKEYQVSTGSANFSNLRGNFVQIAQQLTAGKVTITDKAKAIYNYLASKLSYQYYNCSQHHNVDRALKDGHLNCMDSAFVAVEMLHAVGIEAGYVHGNHTFDDGSTYPHWWTYFVTAHGHRVWFDVGRTNTRWDCKGEYHGSYSIKRSC